MATLFTHSPPPAPCCCCCFCRRRLRRRRHRPFKSLLCSVCPPAVPHNAPIVLPIPPPPPPPPPRCLNLICCSAAARSFSASSQRRHWQNRVQRSQWQHRHVRPDEQRTFQVRLALAQSLPETSYVFVFSPALSSSFSVLQPPHLLRLPYGDGTCININLLRV